MAKIPLREQPDNEDKFFTFVQNPVRSLATFKADTRFQTAVVNLPNSNLCRVLYGFDFGVSGIGETSAIDGKVLALSDEGSSG